MELIDKLLAATAQASTNVGRKRQIQSLLKKQTNNNNNKEKTTSITKKATTTSTSADSRESFECSGRQHPDPAALSAAGRRHFRRRHFRRRHFRRRHFRRRNFRVSP